MSVNWRQLYEESREENSELMNMIKNMNEAIDSYLEVIRFYATRSNNTEDGIPFDDGEIARRTIQGIKFDD